MLRQVDDHPEKVLVAGWSTNDFMADLLRELDHGMSALPSGSEVVFVNNHSPEDTLAPVLRLMNLEYVTVSTNSRTFRCAVALLSVSWYNFLAVFIIID